MAYDLNGAYVPPRRAYYGQTQQPAPPRNTFANRGQVQYNDYTQQPSGGGYEQQYNQYDDNMRDGRQGRSAKPPQFENGSRQNFRQDVDGPPRASGQQQQRQERQYDPRYQQRFDRGRLVGSSLQQQAAETRPNPKMARMYTQEPQVQNQTSRQLHSHPQSNTTARPRTAPQQEKRHDPSKMTMEEWKAKERAKMHAEAALPETLAWDNAFPTFPTKREASRPPTANRESVELEGSAPLTSQRQEARPTTNRGESYSSDPIPQTDLDRQHFARPPIDHKPYSFEPVRNHPGQQPVSPPAQQAPHYERRFSELEGSPIIELPTPQPVAERRHSPPDKQVVRRPPPGAPNGPVHQYHQEVSQMNQESSVPHQPRETRSRGPHMQPIDTRQPMQPQRSGYMNHNPLSPASVPERPSTSQEARGPMSYGMTSPNSTNSQTQMQHSHYEAQASVSSPAQAQPDQARHGSLNDIYSNHGSNRVVYPATAPPRTREEEIEADMPDFDSAAPGGTSLLHKRSQHSNRPANGAINAGTPHVTSPPQQQMNANGTGASVQRHQFHYQQVDPNSRSFAEQQGVKQKQGGITDGFVFELPGGPTQQAMYDDQYLEGMPRQYDTPHELPGPPIQPPFAQEQRPRRSMDDARQMPYRQGAPRAQRMPQNGQPPRGHYPPQQRPDMDRNFSDPRPQPAYVDPMQDRGGSAPPTRQRFQVPPEPSPMGAPLTQQRSAPERPGHTHRKSNPDSLPYHPAPVRPGLLERAPPQQSKPPPVRNYDTGPPSHQRQASIEQPSMPVTAADLDRLRAAVDANPNNYKQALLLVKKLVEAADVLASEGGRADRATVVKNRERYIFDAHKRVKKLVGAGYADAQFYLADCYGQGALGLEVDPKEAFKLYQAAAKAGHPEAAYRTAMCCEMGPEDGGGTSKDYGKAVQWYRRGAALGNAASMFKVGIISLKGLLGQPRNVGEGVSWLKRAADHGETDNPQAFYELATLYESANTNPEVRNKVVADDRYALELFHKAADLGHKYAQFRLGQVYEYGNLGMAIDNRASISWYSKAAAQGEHQAELALSGWYLTGAEGILEHSDMEAYLWARKAASSEPPLAKAMFAMGYFTETGIGCPASVDEAKKWYGRAASYRFPKAQERLEELRKSGSRGPRPANGKLTRNDQKKNEAECAVM